MQTGSSDKSGRDAFELEHFLPYRLSLLTNRVSQGIAACYRDEFGITVPEWRILAVLGQSPAQTASDLAARTAMDKVTIHRAVKALIEKNLLQRRTDREDRRRQQLRLTAAGQRTLEAIIPRARAFEQALLKVLGPGEATVLTRMIEKLTTQAFDLGQTRED